MQPAAADAAPELCDEGGDARDLADHDHRRPTTDAIDVSALPVRLERLLGETLECVLPLRFARRHSRTVASPAVTQPDHTITRANPSWWVWARQTNPVR